MRRHLVLLWCIVAGLLAQPAHAQHTCFDAFDNCLVRRPSGHNLIFPSTPSAGHTWAIIGTGTQTMNAGTAPDGTNTAVNMVADATAGSHGFTIPGPITPAPSSLYTASVYAKAGTSSRVFLELRIVTNWVLGGGAGVVQGSFDLSAVSGFVVAANGTATITNVGNGWFRITVTATSVAAPAGGTLLFAEVANAAGAVSYVGTGESAMFWGLQWEKSAVAGTFVPTVSNIR